MNRRVAVRLITAGLVVGSAAIGFVPIASASTDVTLTPTVEAWYQPNPTCLTPAGCVTQEALPVAPPAELPTLPATSPYPAGTLHVGVTAGAETARTYLRFPFEQLSGKTVTAATLTIPLDVTPESGSASPDLAKIALCATNSTKIEASEGTTNEPPASDCAVSVPATYVATPQPHLMANLGSLAAGLPQLTGLALLPDKSKATPTDAWHVAFSSRTRTDAAKTPPASLTVTLDDEAPEDFGTVDEPVSPPETGGITGVAPVPNTGFVNTPSVQAPVTGAAPTVSGSVANPPVSQPQLRTVGYAYPAVWLLPLAFLILVPAVARSLTKDLSNR